jgi:integrase
VPEYRLVKVSGRENWHITWNTDSGEAKRKSTGTSDKAKAQAALEDFKINQRDASYSTSQTIESLITRYIRDREADGISAPDVLRGRFKALKPRLGDTLYRHLNSEKCRSYAAYRQERGISNATIRDELGLIASALNHAENEGWIDRAPKVWRPPAPPRRERVLTREEARKLYRCCKPFHLKMFVMLGLTTAARSGAILDLTWDRVDLEKRRIDFNLPGQRVTKKRRAIVPIVPALEKELVIALERATSEFVIEYAGRKVKSIKKGFREAVRTAELDSVSPHTLRHTAATWMAGEGTPLFHIAGYLGHTSSRTTEAVYAKHMPDYLGEAANVLGSYADFMRKSPARKRLIRHRRIELE